MATITEGRQCLDFDATWGAFQWDLAKEFVGSMDGSLHQLAGDGVKAADVVGVKGTGSSGSAILLIAEFKDFAQPMIPGRRRAAVMLQAESEKLRRDIVRKVIDTLTGATFAHDSNGKQRSELKRWRAAAADTTVGLLILVCVELSKPAVITMLNNDLRRRLRWLGPNATVLVTSSATPYSALGISYHV
jgi:hypothetical protein